MSLMVCFRTSTASWAVAIEHAVAVRGAEALLPLPVPAPGVIGMVDHAGLSLPVVDTLGTGAGHVLIVAGNGVSLGVVAEEVTGIADVPADDIAPAPPGQATGLVSGVARVDGVTAFVLDVDELARTLPLSEEALS